MTLIPEVHTALAKAVAQRRRRRWWHRLPQRGSALAVVAALFATGGFAAATTPWQPLLSNHTPTTNQPAPAEQRAAFAVLRRPQSDSDRAGDAVELMRANPTLNLGIHLPSVHVVQRDPSHLAVLFSADRPDPVYNGDGKAEAGSDHPVVCLLTQQSSPIDWSRRNFKQSVGRPMLSKELWNCATLAQISASGGALVVDTVGLVPDGVANVVLFRHDLSTVTRPVTNNTFTLPNDTDYDPRPVELLDADGKHVSP